MVNENSVNLKIRICFVFVLFVHIEMYSLFLLHFIFCFFFVMLKGDEFARGYFLRGGEAVETVFRCTASSHEAVEAVEAVVILLDRVQS